jgi:hypothetical protein
MKQYMIYCCSGAGGSFLATVFAQLLGYQVNAKFSNTGHAHDMGRGNWHGAEPVCCIGNHWETNYYTGSRLYYSHVMPDDYIQQNPDVRIIKIDISPKDYRKVTELYVYKAWPEMWTPEEYAKWVGPDYPPYNKNNIEQSKLIRNDLIDDLLISYVKKWQDHNRHVPAHDLINFRTIMGIDNIDLVDSVCEIVSQPATLATRQYVAEYQKLNQSLYLEDYAGQS